MGSSTRKIVVSGLIVSFMLCGLLTLGVQAQKVVLRYADTPYGPSVETAQENWIKSFMIRYPNIEIKIERAPWMEFEKKYSIQAAAGTLPDIVYLHGSWVKKWITTGYLVDLMPYVKENEALADMGDYFPVAVKLYRYKGGLYGLPMDTGPEGVHAYNVKLFKEAGLAPPDKSWTLEGEFLEAAKKLTKDIDGDGKTDQWGITGTPLIGQVDFTAMRGAHLMPFGGRLVNDEETECLITEPGSIKALKFWLGLLHKHHVVVPYEEFKALEEQPFALDKAGMETGASSWSTYAWERFPELEWKVMHAPEGPAGRFTDVMGSCFSITKDSEHPDEAWLFLRDYNSREGLTYVWALTMSGCCARRSAWIEWEEKVEEPPNLYIFREAMEYGVLAGPLGPAACELKMIFGEAMRDAILNPEVDVEKMAKMIKGKVDKALAEYK